jgi:hypothetical protein
MGLVKKSLHVGTDSILTPNSKKQRATMKQRFALQRKGGAEIRRAGETLGASADDLISKQQQQLMLLHYQLMAVYVYAVEMIRGTDPLPVGKEGPLKKATPPWIEVLSPTMWIPQLSPKRLRLFKPAVKALVELHIKTKLAELRMAYVEAEQLIPDDNSVDAFRTWLKDAQDSLARFSSTLTAMVIVRRILAALWPLAIALAAIGSVWSYIRHLFGSVTYSSLVVVISLVLSVMFYIMLGLGVAAARKRAFFLASIPGSHIWNSKVWAPSAQNIVAENIYESEDKLFGYIGKSKKPERPLDTYAFAAIGGIMMLILLVLILRTDTLSMQIFDGVLEILLLPTLVSFVLSGQARSIR